MDKLKHKTSPIYWKKSTLGYWDRYDANNGKLLCVDDYTTSEMLDSVLNGSVVIMTEDEPEQQDNSSRWYAGWINNALIIDMCGKSYWISDHTMNNFVEVEIQPSESPKGKKSYKHITNKSSVDKLEQAFRDFKKVIKEIAQKEHLGGKSIT